MKIKLLALTILLTTNVYAVQVASTKAIANPASGIANQNTIASGSVTYSITNNTSATQSYIIDRYMCINNSHCTHYRDSITVGSGKTNGGTSTITANAVLPAGNYEDEASIQISGFESSYAKGVNSVMVR
jgi:hypothetical protein